MEKSVLALRDKANRYYRLAQTMKFPRDIARLEFRAAEANRAAEALEVAQRTGKQAPTELQPAMQLHQAR
jgi:hypothetical protein